MPHFINHNLKVAKFRSKEICFFFFSKHVYIWYSTSRGDDVMVKRKPQYVKIKEYIIQNIEDEKYNENEQIESEHALCELFGVTRMTVRQALTDLINENIIYSVPKVGSFVCKKSRFKSFDGLNSVTEDCAKKKEDCTSHVVLNELEEATEFKVLNAEGFSMDLQMQDNDKINTIFNYVKDNFQEQITLDEVAVLVSMTVPSFCRYFKKITQKTFTRFVNEYRLVHASKLLAEKPISITEVCFESGFNNFSYFNKSFQEYTGKSASQYRKELHSVLV